MAGRIITARRETTYDALGRKAFESLTIASQTYTVGSEFNARNELVKYTYPDSSIANRAYNVRGGLSELKLDSSVIDTRMPGLDLNGRFGLGLGVRVWR